MAGKTNCHTDFIKIWNNVSLWFWIWKVLSHSQIRLFFLFFSFNSLKDIRLCWKMTHKVRMGGHKKAKKVSCNFKIDPWSWKQILKARCASDWNICREKRHFGDDFDVSKILNCLFLLNWKKHGIKMTWHNQVNIFLLLLVT